MIVVRRCEIKKTCSLPPFYVSIKQYLLTTEKRIILHFLPLPDKITSYWTQPLYYLTQLSKIFYYTNILISVDFCQTKYISEFAWKVQVRASLNTSGCPWHVNVWTFQLRLGCACVGKTVWQVDIETLTREGRRVEPFTSW